MAKARVRYVDAPAKTDVYVGMLAVACGLMALSILLLVLMGGEYTSKEASAGGGGALPNIGELRRSGAAPAPAPEPPKNP